jgi:hypothetical protein
MDEETRNRFRKELVGQLVTCPAAPEGFDRLKASNKELLKYGFPPRPNKDALPTHHAKWERTMSRPLTYVTPEFEILDSTTRARKNTVPMKDAIPPPAGVEGAPNDTIWSGAVNTSPPAGQTFCSVTASWVVPMAYPPQSAKVGNGWKDGTYTCAAWVGIDGFAGDSGRLLQTGTFSTVIVSEGGQITSQYAQPWFEWFPLVPSITYPNFTVKPGDTVTCTVIGGRLGATTGLVGITNLGSNQITSTQVPAQPGIFLKGLTAEWIMEDPVQQSNGQQFPFPDYGTTIFYDCMASSTNGDDTESAESNLAGANMRTLGAGGIALSTPIQITPQVMQVYAYNHQP